MAKQNTPLIAFNRGIISKLALARTDLKRTALSAEDQSNWMPRTLGSMMLRPGWQFLDGTKSNAAAIHIPFIKKVSDTAIIELTNIVMRVRVNEAVISRVAVSSAVANGNFDTDVSSWTDDDQSGATSSWLTGGYLSLIGTGFNAAIRTQQVTVSGGDANKEHALRIVIARGHVTLKVGTTAGADDYISQTTLGVGTHSLAFTPTGNFYVRLQALTEYASLVDSCNVEGAGAMELPTPWLTANLPMVRWDQSGDVLFVACEGFQQRRIERRATRSWSVILYQPEDGPFLIQNTGTTRLTASAISGDITLTASSSLFKSTQVGGLYRITSTGQLVQANLSGEGQYTDPIRITGVGAQRQFSYVIAGTWLGTITLQRSVGEVGSWVDVTTFTGNTSSTFNDALDNQIIFYRLGFNTGNYTSGTAAVSLSYSSGGLTGVVRITAFTSSTSVTASVLTHLGSTTGSSDWAEGQWSDYRGWPTAVSFYEGRLWWAGGDAVIGSVSDAFESFDDTIEGDSAPISRSIGSGPVDRINWLLPLLRLVIGTEMAERTARSSSLDEPLTATNFNLKTPSTRGSTAVPPLVVDGQGIFVRNTRLFLLAYNETYSVASDYNGNELTILCPEIGESGFTRIAVQRYPDTRIHAVRADGGAGVLIFDPAEDVKCWVEIESDGTIEDVFVLPGLATEDEDKVYYLVNRTINGGTVRYLERWALESECVGASLNKQADSFAYYTGVPTTTITAAHLANEEVVVWGDGIDLGTFTLNGSGQATLSAAVSNYVVGLGYTARFKSTKLAYAASMGTALTQRKRLDHFGFILANTHAQGLRYGTSYDNLDDLPQVEEGAVVDPDSIWESYDYDSTEVNDTWMTDNRLCLEAAAPRPATVLGVVMTIDTHDKA